MSTNILEFAKAYHDVYRDRFNENAIKLFDSLVTSSGVDVLENRKHAKEYRVAQKVVDDLTKKANGIKTGRGFAIFGIVAGFIAIVICFILQNRRETHTGNEDFTLAEILVCVGAVLLIIGMILLIKFKINPALSNVNNLLVEKQTHANQIYTMCMQELSPLHAKFKLEHTYQLCKQTLPEITLDKNFSIGRFFQLQSRYGLGENLAENESTIGIFSGDILGNPFVEERRLIQSWGTETYTGSLTISWTDTVRNSNGSYSTVTRTQTLYASVSKPKPYYHQKTTLIFGSEAAPDLSFTHEPTHCERWSEGELKRQLRKGGRELDKLTEKALKNGGTFTEFANEEFDIIFNGTDRDHEVQFRLLFTPLAQKNMMFLMRNPVPYGDDFYFAKRKKLNYVSSEHGQVWDFDPTVERYMLYDIDLCKQRFLAYNNDFFCNLYFELAPVMSIPLYQQHKAEEFIYNRPYKRNFTSYEAECLANTLDQMTIQPDDCQTQVVLKTHFMAKEGGLDKLTLVSHGFATVQHVEYVSTFGGDGRFHSVPVPWLEYVPVSKQFTFEMQESEEQPQQTNTIFKHGLLARLLNL